jgi:hypothetical protein
MKAYKILVDGVVIGFVINPSGNASSDAALSAWNNANPSYQGDTAEDARFVQI